MNTVEYSKVLLEGLEQIRKARVTFGTLCDNPDGTRVDDKVAKVFASLVQSETILSNYEENAKILANQLSFTSK